MHPLGQRRFLGVKRLRPSDVLSTRPPRITRCCSALPTQLQLKLGQARKDTGHHPACRIRGVDALTQRPQNDASLTKLPDRDDDLSSIAP
jgi:hypothetical protein